MHKLQKQILSIDYFEEASAMAFQDRIRDCYYKRIVPEMEALLKKYDHRQGIIKIDRIELELGQINEGDFEKEWPQRFKEQFEKELAKRIKLILNNQSGSRDSITPLWQEDIEILEHFLLRGTLPWYGKGKKTSPGDALQNMLEKQPAELILLIKKHASNKRTIRRIVLQFAEKQVMALIRLLEPKEADFIVSTIQQTEETHKRKPIVQHRSAALKTELWEFALSYILIDRGSYFNTKDYMRSMIFALADSYGLDRIQLLALLYSSVKVIGKEYNYQLTFKSILSDIYHEYVDEDKQHSKSETDVKKQTFEDLMHFIAHGSMQVHSKTSKTQLAQIYQSWLAEKKNHGGILSTLKKIAHNTAGIERLSKLTISEKQFAKLVQVIHPTEADYLSGWSENLQRLQEEKRIFQSDSQVFRQEKFFLILTILLTDRGSVFNRKSFLQQLLLQISRKYNIALRTFIRYILDSLDTDFIQTPEIREVKHLLNELITETAVDETEDEEQRKKEQAESIVFIKDSILYWATHQKQPWWLKKSEKYKKARFEELWDMLIKRESALLSLWLYPLFKNENATEFLLAKLTPSQLSSTLNKLVDKPLAAKILSFKQLNVQLLQSGSIKSLKAKSFTMEQWRFTLNYLAISKTAVISFENYLHQAAAYFPFLLNMQTPAYLSGLDSLLKKDTSTAHQMLKTALDKNTKKIRSADKKAAKSETKQDSMPSADFINKWHNKPQSSLAFQHALFMELSRLHQKTDTKLIIRFINALFSIQSLEHMLLNTKQEPLVKLLLEILLDTHFYKQAHQFKELDTLYAISFRKGGGKAQIHHLKALIIACMQQDFSEEGLLGNYFQALGKFLQKSPMELVKQVLSQKNEEHLLKNKNLKKILEEAKASTPEKEKKELIIPFKEEKDEDSPIESIAVNNAGAVILWPFMSTFFQRLDMLQEKRFTNKETQQRAVQLWQYLIDEQADTAEEHLSLLKILCGLPLAEPIIKSIIITEEEKALCDSLLQGVIAQWKALKNTSPTALRETFLQREGVLYQKEEQWELHVEQKAFDVLLDQIPWGIQFIKLPWMETTLYTKWR